MLEGSKTFAKDFMAKYKIPTAAYRSFRPGELHQAEAYSGTLSSPVVVKADGLAAGKGVVICETHQAAVLALRDMMLNKAFGSAGEIVVVEEFLVGEEASVFALTDGERYVTLASAQDHKRILDHDQGKNTGGMGAYAPAPIVTAEVLQRVREEVIEPLLEGMRSEGTPYRGCLYCGLMISNGRPKVVEFNCRFGDPETQPVMMLLQSDLLPLLLASIRETLNLKKINFYNTSSKI